ncbi:ESX secretion-associated protein EspG [Mycolicibacterium mengxianglii]|uniref:ESX secretion-associated protein EspG n=1 Tax=Mycolicibacterium mengxianglii TaxID=2736649 RepID=UPI0018D0AABD|nr:ESX secretion-associated protein EspG [Mycolicibacterium mengxianglii]
MLTTTLDGLWVLQILTGIEVLAPELGLRPVLPSVETKDVAMLHPIAEELKSAGVIDEHGTVDPAVVEWLTVLSRRDMGLLMQATRPGTAGAPSAPAQVTLSRFAQWWVALERSDIAVRLSGAGTSSSEGAANQVISTQLERLCGSAPPAAFKPVTVPTDRVLAEVRDRDSLRRFLVGNVDLDAEQLHVLLTAADPTRSAQASIVAIQSGVDSGNDSRVTVGGAVVTVIDTPDGRVMAEHLQRDGKRWMILTPGSHNNIVAAINEMVRRLPAAQEWHSYRKVV